MKPCILAVDDDSEMLALVKLELASPNWTIETAPDLLKGFEKARTIKPFLIVTDFNMPTFGTGTDLIRVLRREPVLAKTPVILMTSMDLSRVRSRLPPEDPLLRLTNKPPDFTLIRGLIRELTGVGDPAS